MLFSHPLRLIFFVVIAVIIAVTLNERAFLKRYFTYEGDPLALPLSWYEPLETIVGTADDALPIATRQALSVPSEALNMAASYAAAQGSQALIVIHKGVIQLEQYWGEADRSTRFNPQSMSKSVLGMLVGIAIEDGHIESVNDPISHYIEEWRDDPRGSMTIKQALQMTGGLEQMATSYEINLFSRGARYNFGDDFDGMLLNLEQVDPPGTKFEYNNEESNLLGIVLERATGQRYADYLSEKIWKPVGLKTADMYLDRLHGSVMKHCCILSRPYDWAKIGLMFDKHGKWNDVQVVPAAWVEDMITPSALADFYGYQVWLGSNYIAPGVARKGPGESIISPERYLADDMIIFLGFGDQRVWISPTHELVIVYATMRWASEWDETKIPNTILRALNKQPD